MENGLEKAKLDRSNAVIQLEILGSGCEDGKKLTFKGYLGSKIDRVCRMGEGSVKDDL